MKIISYDGYTFSTGSYYAAVEQGTGRGQFSVMPLIRSRHNAASSLTGIQITERAIPVVFGYQGGSTFETAFLTLLGKLNATNPYPRKLVAQLNSGTQVECMAIVTTPGAVTIDQDVNLLRVVFITTDPYWTDPTQKSIAGYTWKTTTSWNRTINNTGQAWVPATIELIVDTTASANFNYYSVDIENKTELNWYRELVFIDIGDTRSASGFAPDPRYASVYLEGVQQPRILVNYGTQRTYVAIAATIAAGTTRTYEVVINKTDSDTDKITNTRSLQTNALFNGFYTPVYIDDDSGTATAGGASTLTDSSKTWRTVGGWAGGFVEIVGGTGSGQCRQISSNTATQLTVRRAWTTNPDSTSVYCIHTSGWFVDGGICTTGTLALLTDSSQSWDADSLVGGSITITAGTGSGQTRTITANTATTVSASFSPAPDNTSVYVIRKHGYSQYNVDQTDVTSYVSPSGAVAAYRHGGWQVSARNTPPTRVAFGGDCVNGWRRVTYLDNRDDFNQLRWTSYVVASATRYSGLLNARRRRGQDSRLQEEGTGDGVAITSALGYQGIRFDYRLLNENGVGKFVLATREAGSEDWADIITNNTTYASLTAQSVTYQSFAEYGTPTQMYMGVLPYDGVEIPTTANAGDDVQVQWYQTLRLYQNANSIGITVGTKESRTRIGGQIDLNAGYGATTRVMYIGLRAGTDRELFLPADGLTKLVIDSQTGDCYYVDGIASVHQSPWAVKVLADGRLTSTWLMLPPGSTTYYADNFYNAGTVTVKWYAKYFG